MNDTVIANASPLILLSRGGHGALLRVLADEVLVPEPVASEINARGTADPTVIFIAHTPWVKVVPAPETPEIVLEWGLGPGESAVIGMGYLHARSIVLLDDGPARKCAAALNLKVLGTLGIVLKAKRQGVVSSARPVVEDLLRGGMYLSRSLLDAALALVDE